MAERPLHERLERWYAAGEKGLQTLCNDEDVPQAVKDAVALWYLKGRARFDFMVAEVKELEK